jgi:hypothetical protein
MLRIARSGKEKMRGRGKRKIYKKKREKESKKESLIIRVYMRMAKRQK